MPGHLGHAADQLGERELALDAARARPAVGVHGLAEQRDLASCPTSASARTSARIWALGRLTSRPRVRGTTQYEQNRSQPSMTVTNARPGVGEA